MRSMPSLFIFFFFGCADGVYVIRDSVLPGVDNAFVVCCALMVPLVITRLRRICYLGCQYLSWLSFRSGFTFHALRTTYSRKHCDRDLDCTGIVLLVCDIVTACSRLRAPANGGGPECKRSVSGLLSQTSGAGAAGQTP